MSELDRRQDDLFGLFFGARLDHHDAVFVADHHDVHRGRRALGVGGIHHELAVHAVSRALVHEGSGEEVRVTDRGQAPVIETDPGRHQPESDHRPGDSADLYPVVQSEYPIAPEDEPGDHVPIVVCRASVAARPRTAEIVEARVDGEGTGHDEQDRGREEDPGQRDPSRAQRTAAGGA